MQFSQIRNRLALLHARAARLSRAMEMAAPQAEASADQGMPQSEWKSIDAEIYAAWNSASALSYELSRFDEPKAYLDNIAQILGEAMGQLLSARQKHQGVPSKD